MVGRVVGRSFAELGSTSAGLRAVRAQRVRINGAPCSHASRVRPGDTVTLLPPPAKLTTLGDATAHDGANDGQQRACAFAQGLARSGKVHSLGWLE